MKRLLMTNFLAAAAAICLPTPASSQQSGVLPAGAAERLRTLNKISRIDTVWSQALERAVARAINPDDYECGRTDFDAWIDDKISKMGIDDFLTLANLGVLYWPAYYTMRFDQDAS